MELASIYLDETKLDQNNKFTINFLTTESDFNVFFNRNTICYITNLDLNLILDDKEITETKNKSHHQKVIELSQLSNELISKSFINTKFDEMRLVHQFPTSISNLIYKLHLSNEIIDLCSYKYEFLDTTENKIKKFKIYDQYQHLQVGMQFYFNDVSTYTISLTGDKLKKKLEYDNEKLKIDFWAKSLNSILYELDPRSFLLKTPLYNELHYVYLKNGLTVNKKDLLHEYYFNIETDNHHVICNENKHNSLNLSDKKDAVFIVLKNKKIRAIKNRTFWLPRWNFRGDHKLSFVNDLIYLGARKLSKDGLDFIRKNHAYFPFIRLDKFRTLDKDVDLDILDNDVQYFTNLNFNPFYFMWTSSSDHRDFFRKRVAITNRKEQIDTLSPNQQTKLKKIMSEEVDKIKQLVEEEEEVINSLKKKEKNLKQKQFYLYDNSNIIKPTLLTSLNKKINLYGKMELQSTNVGKISKLIKTEDSLKFQVSRSIFKEELDFEIQNIVKEERIKTTDNKIHNITIVMVPQITKKYTLIDSIKIIGFSSTTEKLNPVSILIENNDLINHFNKNKNAKFRLTVNSVLLSSNIKNEDQVIHLNTTSLTDARYSLINNKLLKGLGQINLNEIEDFDLIKEKKSWLNCVLMDSKKVPYGSKHFSYSFITNKLVNILNFEIEFLNRKGERLEWEADEKRIPNVTFTIDILR